MEHDGVVTRVTRESVTVSVESHASCEGCRSRGACGLSGDGRREIVVRQPGGKVAVGERVTVRVGSGNALRSVLLAYALPAALAVGVVALLSSRAGEVVAAVVTLIVVAGYFFLIFLCRNVLARTIKFTIIPRQE